MPVTKSKKLTIKEEKFCLKYHECGNASEAYKSAFSTKKMKPHTVNTHASKLLKVAKIRARVEELKAKAAETHNITVNDLLVELEEARLVSKNEGQGSAMTAATMGKARLLGHDKQIHLIKEKKTIIVNVVKPK